MGMKTRGIIARCVLALGLILGIELLGASAHAETTSCAQVSQQLLAMQKAQVALLSAMVNKNESMAAIFENYAKDFESEERKLKRTDIQSLHSSAQAFRNHREREQQLIEKFSVRSNQLIEKTNECLAKGESLDVHPAKVSQSAESANIVAQ